VHLTLRQVDVEFPTAQRVRANGIDYVFGDPRLVQQPNLRTSTHYVLVQEVRGRSFPRSIQVVNEHDGTPFAQVSLGHPDLSLTMTGNVQPGRLRLMMRELVRSFRSM
jgi:hypothetical protein